MRLWHQDLIPRLPRQQLLGQHREICALRGKGWGKPHSTINYIFKYPMENLVVYHHAVMQEMKRRGYKVDKDWYRTGWRGKQLGWQDGLDDTYVMMMLGYSPIYPEHNDDYMQECLNNLKQKGVDIDVA